MDNIKIRFGKRVREVRRMQDMTQEQLSEDSGIAISFVSDIERGNKAPTIETIEKLAFALKVPINELMTFDTGVKVIEEYHRNKIYELMDEYTNKIAKVMKDS